MSVNYAERSFAIAAGATIYIERASDFIACLEASADFRISLDNAPESDFGAGLMFEPTGGFQSVQIRNPGDSPITLTVGFGRGAMRDSRVTINAGVTLPTRESAPDMLTTGAAVSAANAAAMLIAAADVLRREILIVNTDSSATVYIGGNAAAAAGEGVPILPGQSLTLETSAAIYARNDSGAAVALAVAEMGWSA